MYERLKKRAIALILVLDSVLLLVGCQEREETPLPTAAEKNGAIVISWAETESALHYRLFRQAEGESEFRFLDDVKATEYTDKAVQKGGIYRYKLQAVFESRMGKGVVTNAVAIPEALGKQLTVESVTRMDKYTAVVMLAETEGNAVYEILRSEREDGDFTPVGTTEGRTFYDTTAEGEIPYFYAVRVLGSSAREWTVPRQIGYNAKAVFQVPVLMYHEFVTQEDLDSGVLFDEYAIWQSELEADLIWLKENGYTTITSRELCNAMEGKGTLPEKPVILSIDDGKYGVYKRAYPLLQKYGMKMSLAVIGSQIDLADLDPVKRGDPAAPYSTWEEIGKMSDSGLMEITSHTQDLHIYRNGGRQGANVGETDTLESFLPTAQKDFLKITKKIKKATGKATHTLAYPYSKRSVTSDMAWLKSGYKILFGGDDEKERKTMSNFFVEGAGINRDSAVMRRIPRMTGTPISEYMQMIEETDAY